MSTDAINFAVRLRYFFHFSYRMVENLLLKFCYGVPREVEKCRIIFGLSIFSFVVS